MTCLRCSSPITFPVLSVTGAAGAAGAAGSAGTSVIFDNTPAAAVATLTTNWETFTGMTTSVTSLADAGDKILISGVVINNTVPSVDLALPKQVKIQINAVDIQDGSVDFQFELGVTKCYMEVEVTVISATSLYINAVWTAISPGVATIREFTDIIAVADVTSLAGVRMMANSTAIGDMSCEQFSVKFLNK